MKRSKKIRAFLFDMDGLLLDTENIHIRAYMELTRQLNVPQTFESLKRFIGHSHKVTVKYLIDELRCTPSFDELILREQELYFQILESERPAPLSGVREMFDAGDTLQLKRALVSSSVAHQVSPTMQIVVEHLSRSGPWRDQFHAVSTGDRVQRLKPAPDPYLLAMKELELDPDECVAFEDSPAGVEAACAAGCRVVAIPNIYLQRDDVVQGRTPHVFTTLQEAHANLKSFC